MKRKRTSVIQVAPARYYGRQFILMLALLIGIGVLLLRAIYIEIVDQERLQSEAYKRQMRTMVVPAYRGMIVDRHNEPLAVSSPATALTCDPYQLLKTRLRLKTDYQKKLNQGVPELTHVAEEAHLKFENDLNQLAIILGITKADLIRKITLKRNKRFIYLGRQLSPETSEMVMKLELPAIRSQSEYRRFYPMSEMTGHIVGFTNIDGKGVEGIESSMDAHLAGQAGSKRVVKDGRGRLMENVEQLEAMIPGQDVQLTIDRRIQYMAYKALKQQVYKMKAKAGAAIVLDTETSEILAMVNVPSFNPNNRSALNPYNYRNRAVMDAFEPGSTIKPFTIVAALNARVISGDVEIETSPGFLEFGNYKVRDIINYGSMSIAKILSRSSNVGASKIALLMKPREHWLFLSRLGFGVSPDAGFPNEASGSLVHYKKWKDIDHASHGYGYGLSVSLLQLANAYSIFGSGGILRQPTIFPRNVVPRGDRIVSKKDANDVLEMMETVTQPGGTGTKARVIGYRVAGKTGTAYKYLNGRYNKKRRLVSFIGVAPVSNPKVVVAVMIDEPKVETTGGRAAAPLFSSIMKNALRVLDVAPDQFLLDQQKKKKQATLMNKQKEVHL